MQTWLINGLFAHHITEHFARCLLYVPNNALLAKNLPKIAKQQLFYSIVRWLGKHTESFFETSIERWTYGGGSNWEGATNHQFSTNDYPTYFPYASLHTPTGMAVVGCTFWAEEFRGKRAYVQFLGTFAWVLPKISICIVQFARKAVVAAMKVAEF